MSVSKDVLNGIICQICGVWMTEVEEAIEYGITNNSYKKIDDFFDNPPGYPRTCKDCKKDNVN